MNLFEYLVIGTFILAVVAFGYAIFKMAAPYHHDEHGDGF